MNTVRHVTVWRERQSGRVVWKWGEKGPFLNTASQESFDTLGEVEPIARRMAAIYNIFYLPHNARNDHPGVYPVCDDHEPKNGVSQMAKVQRSLKAIKAWSMFMVKRGGEYLRDDGGNPEWTDFTLGKQLPSRAAALDYIEGLRLDSANCTIEKLDCVLEIRETQEGK